MNHLPILLARHLSCLRLVEHPSASLHIVLSAAIHANLRGSTRQPLCSSHVRKLSGLVTRKPQLLKCTFDQSSRVFFIDVRARRQHHCSSVEPAFDVWSRTFAFTASPKSTSSPSQKCAKWPVSCLRCSLQSFFDACFKPRVSGIIQKSRIRRFVATVEE